MSERSYTKEQEIIVEKILKHPQHEYYKILEVEKSATDSEIKKAYRKISLKVHPDKNSHPKADESFKKVAKAFEVLGDSSKRRIYDQTGADPGSRSNSGFNSGTSSGFDAGNHPFFQAGGPFGFTGQQGFNFQTGGMGGGPDLFDILFGGQPGGMGGGTTFTFGGPGGVRFTTAGGNPFQQRRRQPPPQQQQQQHQPQNFFDSIRQYIPMLLILIIPLLSNLFAETPEKFQLRPEPPFTTEKISNNYKIPYYITTKQAETLPVNKINKLGREAERLYIGNLQELCHRETNHKEHQIQNAYGWLFTDEEKLSKARQIKLPNCEKLSQLGVNLL